MKKLILVVLLIASASICADGIFVGEEVRGNTRICYYDMGGGDIRTKTVPASDPCPMDY